MMVKELKRMKGYLYSIWSGRLRVFEGEVVTVERKYDSYGIRKQSSYFLVNAKKKVTCGEEPGVIYNKMVWLTERNDDIGRKLLIEYEEVCIEQLKEKIDNHKYVIKLLNEAEL